MTKTILEIEVLDAEKRRVPSKHYVYVIMVKWSDHSRMVVYRRYSRFFDLQTQLLDKFPIEAGATDPSLRIIPFLPGKIFFGRSQVRDVAMKRLGEINNYCKSLLALPPHISQCEEVLEFFEVEPDDLDPPKEEPKHKGEKKAEKISKPKQLEQFMAVADYEAQDKGEINLQAGMVVEVNEKSESGWWFVHAEEHQGWVPSTYLQPVNGSSARQAPCAEQGQEEKYICIEMFSADNADEISLEKGVVVEVLQKNMDGWWSVRYQGQEGFAPATYLKKSTDPYAKSLVEKSKQSGVKIISNLADVSNLMASSTSPRNSSHFSSNSPRDSANVDLNALPGGGVQAGAGGQGKASDAESEEEKDIVHHPGPKGDSYAAVVVKQRSLERGGSLRPPPRKNSVKQMIVHPTSPTPRAKPSTYITVADFEDTVGDGISFTAGESVTVLEKTSSGWWFVERGQDQGWVPESYLELCSSPETQTSSSTGSHAAKEQSDDSSEESDEDEQTLPPSAALASALNSRLKGLSSDSKSSASSAARAPKLPGKASSKPPPLPSKPQEESQGEKNLQGSRGGAAASSTEAMPAAGLASALKSRFESKPPGQTGKAAEKPGPPGLPKKPTEKPGLPGKPTEKPAPPGLPKKPTEKPGPPGLPSKPAEKPGLPDLPKKPEKPESSAVAGNVAGLTSTLRSRFESQQPEDKPSKPAVKPAVQHSKPAPPSKSYGQSGESQWKPDPPNKPDAGAKPSTVLKPALPFKNGSTLAGADRPQMPPPKMPSGPPKLPSKSQVASKPSSDPNNNSSSDSRPTSSRVHSMAAAFGKMDVGQPPANSRDSGSRPTLPVKKPTLPQPPTQKPGNRNSEVTAGKPHVGNLVSELGSKLQFGGGGSIGGGAHKSPEPSPISKTGAGFVERTYGSKPPEPSPVAKAAPWSAPQRDSSAQPTAFKPPAPPQSSSGVEYEVVADFAAEGKDEISLQCGDVVEVVNQQQADWWLVRQNGEEGWAPSSYLEPAAEWDD